MLAQLVSTRQNMQNKQIKGMTNLKPLSALWGVEGDADLGLLAGSPWPAFARYTCDAHSETQTFSSYLETLLQDDTQMCTWEVYPKTLQG